MTPRTNSNRAAIPVLYIGPDRVAWLGVDGKSLFEHFADHNAVDALDSVATLLAENKIKRRPCVVALGSGFVKQKQLELPSSLSSRELGSVLKRRTEELATGSGGVVYAAVPLAGHTQLLRKAQQPWLVYTVDGNWATETGLRLRKLGIEARRVVVAELAGVSVAAHQTGDNATVFVSYLGDSVGVALLADDGLVDTLSIPIHSLDVDGLATSLVQELRNLDSSWRRLSEGGSVGRVEFLGFCVTWRDRVEPAARMILPDVELSFHSVVEIESETGSLTEALHFARCASPLLPDLGIRLPYGKFTTASLAAAGALTIVLCANELRSITSDLIGRYKVQIVENEEAAATVDQLTSELAEVESSRNEFAAEWNAFLRTSQANLPMRAFIADALSSTAGHSTLETLEFSAEQHSKEFRMTAATLTSTLHASSAMAQTLAAYREKSAYGDIYLEPESQVANQSSEESELPIMRFTVEGTWSARK